MGMNDQDSTSSVYSALKHLPFSWICTGLDDIGPSGGSFLVFHITFQKGMFEVEIYII